MTQPSTDVAAAERALERLFRLSMGRRLHDAQTAAAGVDVTRAGFAVLRTVDDAGELTMGAVAQEASMDPAAAARQVKLLEDEGLVERRTPDDDGRVVVVRLTETGRDVCQRIVALRASHMADVLARWPASDRAALAALVDRLVVDLRTVPYHHREGARR